MSFEIFKGIVDDLWKLGTRRIDLIGRGEPFNNRAAMKMIRYAKSRDMHIQLVSNGSRVTQPIAKELVALEVDRLNVSLNAGTPQTYPQIHVTESPEKYLGVKKNLRFLSDCKIAAGSGKPVISLSFVINSRNYFEIEQMVEAAREVGAQGPSSAISCPTTAPLTLGSAPTSSKSSRHSGRARRESCGGRHHKQSAGIRRQHPVLHAKRDGRAASGPLLCRLVHGACPGQRQRPAVLPMLETARSGDERAALLGDLGGTGIFGLPACSEVAAGEERTPHDLPVRQLPAAAAQFGDPQFPPSPQPHPGREGSPTLHAERVGAQDVRHARAAGGNREAARGRGARRARQRSEEARRCGCALTGRARASCSARYRASAVVAKSEWTQGEANPRFVVTSLKRDEADARCLYEEHYCARRHKEQDQGMPA